MLSTPLSSTSKNVEIPMVSAFFICSGVKKSVNFKSNKKGGALACPSICGKETEDLEMHERY